MGASDPGRSEAMKSHCSRMDWGVNRPELLSLRALMVLRVVWIEMQIDPSLDITRKGFNNLDRRQISISNDRSGREIISVKAHSPEPFLNFLYDTILSPNNLRQSDMILNPHTSYTVAFQLIHICMYTNRRDLMNEEQMEQL